MKPWPTSGPIMRRSSQKAREAMSSRSSLARSQRNLREGMEDLLGRQPLPELVRTGPVRSAIPRRDAETQRQAQRNTRTTVREGWQAEACPTKEEECPQEWGH